MHDNGTDANARHKDDIFEYGIFFLVAHHRATAVFYNDYLTAEVLNIRKRLYERSRLFYGPL